MSDAKGLNDRICIDELSSLLAIELVKFGDDIGSPVVLEPLNVPNVVADSPTFALVKTVAGQPKAVISFARPISPDLVMRGVKNAESVSSLVGKELGEAIVKPLISGYVAGRSYAMLPWYRDLSHNKLFFLLQQLALRRYLLAWLRQSTAAAVLAHGSSLEASHSFYDKLQYLAKQSFLTRACKTALAKAVQRLESNRWKPRHTFDHNDFWMGNVLLTSGTGNVSKHTYPFVLIDWAGANQKGYGVYDLIRLAGALKLSRASLRRELISYSQALQCLPEDLCGHLLASLGHLHQHLEHFPEEIFTKLFHSCWTTISQALPESK